jgi:hypothetical protein
MLRLHTLAYDWLPFDIRLLLAASSHSQDGGGSLGGPALPAVCGQISFATPDRFSALPRRTMWQKCRKTKFVARLWRQSGAGQPRQNADDPTLFTRIPNTEAGAEL